MPRPFVPLRRAEFESLFDRFPFVTSDCIVTVHLHHTWRPTHAQFSGVASIESMARFHTETMHWSDIAQHVTIDPTGVIWTGRDWNRAPASSTGFNGRSDAHPFMVEIVGNFDKGHDVLGGEQLASVLAVIAHVQVRFALPADALVFHHQMKPSKSCPGTSLDPTALIENLRQQRDRAQNPPDDTRAPLFAASYEDSRRFIAGCERASSTDVRDDGEPPEDALGESDSNRAVDGESRGVDDLPLTPAEAASLAPHVVNMVQGQFVASGEYATRPADVDAIFQQSVPAYIQARRAAGATPHILFYAHGGLVNERTGLRMALRHIPFWRANGIYPIYFVWETGLGETIGQLLSHVGTRAPVALRRDIADFTTDPIVEGLARLIGGVRVWGGMKLSAERAAEPDRGASDYVALQLSTMLGAGDMHDVKLHAIGHSAGSIFHAHFVPCLLQRTGRALDTLQFMAPALRVDTFHEQLFDAIADARVKEFGIFTMNKHYETRDDCRGVYRKSLLYLIRFGLEPEPKTPILGLEESLRDDPRLRTLLDLDRPVPDPACPRVTWSKTEVAGPRASSEAIHHGDFDDDAATIQSMARRLLDWPDSQPIEPFRPDASGRDVFASGEADGAPPSAPPSTDLSAVKSPLPPGVPALLPGKTTADSQATKRRTAICVGIDLYPEPNRLYGCVADATSWRRVLEARGYEVAMLLDGDATHHAILDRFTQAVRDAEPGDSVVLQYAGHGTQLPDLNDDEADRLDEALCPVNFGSGAFILDDDLGRLFDLARPGVRLTGLMDCCHSGTISRMAAAGRDDAASATKSLPRYIIATDEMIAAHKKFRPQGRTSSVAAPPPSQVKNEIVFSACKAEEVAYEQDGHGQFTLTATELLTRNAATWTQESFIAAVVAKFGAGARQTPQLDCAPDKRATIFVP